MIKYLISQCFRTICGTFSTAGREWVLVRKRKRTSEAVSLFRTSAHAAGGYGVRWVLRKKGTKQRSNEPFFAKRGQGVRRGEKVACLSRVWDVA